MTGRVAPVLAVTGLQVVAAAVALGVPDLGQAAAFMTTSVPTAGAGMALLQVVLWLAVLTSFALSLWAGVRRMRRPAARSVWCGAVLAAGVCVLLAGLLRHLDAPALTMTGGSLQEATQELAR